MNRVLTITIILISFSIKLSGQVNDSSIRKIVLENNITDSLYVFGKWNKNKGTETHLKYLGIIKSNHTNYKIMISSWFWGMSKRATSRILVYNQANKYVGNYYMSMTYDLPKKIENNQIVFLNTKNSSCDKKVITRLSFKKGIPEKFFLQCKNDFGNIYSFNQEKE